MSKSKQTLRRSTRPAPSVGAQALVRDGKVVSEAAAPEQTNDDDAAQSVAISGVTLVQDRAEAFVKQWSDATVADIESGWLAEEKRRKNCVELMFDYRADFADNLDALMALPAPYTEAPKGMTPHKWQQDRNNKPWPFDKWSERVTQSQGGKRNVNYSFYLIAFDRSADGVKIGEKITALKDMIANYGKAALTGEYQGWEKDQLQTELSMYESRRSTAGENIRKAIGLHRAFESWETYADTLLQSGKGPWSYPVFSIATRTNADGNEEPASSKKPVRFGVRVTTKDAKGAINNDTTFKPPVSVDTFLNYDVDLYKASMQTPGADVYNSVVESASVESGEPTVKPIKLPFSAESWIACCGLMQGFIEKDENRAAIMKRLAKKDANGKLENEAELKSVIDLVLDLLPLQQAFKGTYEKLTLSDTQAAKLERVSN